MNNHLDLLRFMKRLDFSIDVDEYVLGFSGIGLSYCFLGVIATLSRRNYVRYVSVNLNRKKVLYIVA